MMYEQKQKSSIKNKKQTKEKHEQQKNRNKIKTANCTEIHKTDVKQKPQNKDQLKENKIFSHYF